ncbi:MAG: translation initiation factor IF-2 [Buchnera aphidicola (Schlechtendalia chinensis)]
MMEIDINILSKEMNISVEKLVQKCVKAGIIKDNYNFLTKNEKKILEKYFKNTNHVLKNTLTLKRKTRSTLNISNMGGKNKCVYVEIRKHKTYTKPKEGINNSTLDDVSYNSIKNEYELLSNSEQKISHFHHSAKNVSKKNDTLNNIKKDVNVNNAEKKVNSIFQNIGCNNVSSKKIELQYNENVLSPILKETKKNKDKKNNWSKDLIRKKSRNVSNTISTRNFNRYTGIKDNNRLHHQKKIKNTNNRNNKTYLDKKFNHENYKSFSNLEKSNKVCQNSTLQQIFMKPSCVINRDITINNVITVCELANKMAVKSSEIIKKMMKLGYIVTINQSLDKDMAQLVAEEMGHKVTIYHEDKLEQDIMKNRDISNERVQIRPPIVAIMGHVDHGKTSLLDYIRLTKIASQEAGGITQHIGAYHIEVRKKIITFLDTPGHAAFTAMRSRGAQITDIVVLVVASDDGVKPQTIEAIQHAQAASVPILVAINKIDKPNSEPEKVKNELIKYNILPEEWGGDNIFVNISAKTGEGIDNLLKSILLQSEMLELKTTISGMATGLVIESFLDKGKGPIATILIQEGTLKKGDIVLCGLEYGKIRAIKNSLGKEVQFASPSIPVEILGLSGIPIAGDKVVVVGDEKKAKEVSIYRQMKFREKKLTKKSSFKLSNIFEKIKKDKILELNIVLKSDVQGSLEAISDSLNKLSDSNAKVNIIGKGVGNVTETDAYFAFASKAIIIGFNVKADFSAQRIIESENLDFRHYSVIYHIIDEIKRFIHGMRSPTYKQEIIGLAEVRNVFKSPNFGSVAGCMVIEGIVRRHDLIKILRKNKVIYEGRLESLKRFKEDTSEVRNGVECGIGIKNYSDICVSDLIETFRSLEIKTTSQ